MICFLIYEGITQIHPLKFGLYNFYDFSLQIRTKQIIFSKLR